ncbi:hypothetical protein [Streptomyces sp. B21-083]|uniref:hypothetical protein n=1 Tax=Streptomyces sp. B21-083 TaxID=3039410 RepID=UPI002FEE9887
MADLTTESAPARRTGCSAYEVPGQRADPPQHFGKEVSLRAIWRKWLTEGVLDAIVKALGDYEGTEIDESRWLPEMRIRGVLESPVDTDARRG